MSNIKLIIFDLDGTLIESTKDLHYTALNQAISEISPKHTISADEHLNIYDALSTKQKLTLMSELKGLDISLHEKISIRKQILTFELIDNLKFELDYKYLFETLKNMGIKTAICTNSIKKTTNIILNKLHILDIVDLVLTNDDVINPKPSPEIFNKAIEYFNLSSDKVLIFEDSKYGIQAANASGAYVHKVDNVYFNVDMILDIIEKIDKINIIIPMAGYGSRFVNANYKLPKPLIDVNGKPMIEMVIDNINMDGNYIYIVRKEHFDNYNLKELLNRITPNCKIITVDSVTDGAACTVLLSKELIDNNSPLLIVNSDQYIEWDSAKFLDSIKHNNIDGSILTFNDNDPKWSYVKVDEFNNVIELKEKVVISDLATVGIYYWNSGSNFVKYAEDMIQKNIRVNNEFYVAPVYNLAIEDGKIIKNYKIEKMYGTGTPEDLNYFLENYKK